MVDQQTIGGLDVGTQVARGLAPLADVVTALNHQNTLLTNIHQVLRSGIGLQANTGAANTRQQAQQAVALPQPYIPGPSGPPGQTGTPTPVPRGPAGGSTGVGGSGGGGGGTGGPQGPQVPGQPPGGGFAMAGGEGLVDRAYNSLISKVPFLSIPGSLRNEYQSQINKNNYYRGVTGAESHAEAFGMRFQEEKERLDTMRLFDKEEAQTVHRGLAAMGINTRDESILPGRFTYAQGQKFAYEAKEQYGATVEESMGILSVASKQAQVDLTGLNDQLKALSAAAGDAGVSAAESRKKFVEAWAVNTEAGMSGNAGKQWAMAATSANTMAGPQFAGDTGYSRLATDTGYRAMMAAQNGMTPGQMAVEMRQNPAAAAQQQTDTFINYMRNILPADGFAWLQEQAQNASSDPGTIANDFLTYHWNDARDPDAVLVPYANAFRPGSDEFTSADEVIRNLVKEMMGATTASQLKTGAANAGATDLSGVSKSASGVKALDYGLEDLGGSQASKTTPPRVVGGKGGAYINPGTIGTGPDTDMAGEATKTYVDRAKSSGERVAVLDRMLKTMTGKEEGSQMVSVDTGSGKRVVTLAEAMRDFPDQLATGSARFVGGKNAGKNIGAYNEGAVQQDPEALKRAAESREKDSSAGTSEEAWMKAHPEDRFKAAAKKKEDKGGKYEIGLSPAAAKFFQITKDGDPTMPNENNNGWGGAAKETANTVLFGAPKAVSTVLGWLD